MRAFVLNTSTEGKLGGGIKLLNMNMILNLRKLGFDFISSVLPKVPQKPLKEMTCLITNNSKSL